MLTSHQIWQSFLNFYQQREHALIESLPLKPPPPSSTTLWTVPCPPLSFGLRQGAGPWRNRVTLQRHFSASLKVLTERHPKLYHRLSSCSLVKQADAIEWVWQLITTALPLDRERLYVSVHPQDAASYACWRDRIGLPVSHLIQSQWNYDRPQNTGHGGYTCWLHYDFQGLKPVDSEGMGAIAEQDDFVYVASPPADLETNEHLSYLLVDGPVRFLSFGTLAFKTDDYTGRPRTPLAQPYVETSLQLERLTQVLQGAPTLYDTDVFLPVIQTVERLSGLTYVGTDQTSSAEGEPGDRRAISFQVIADHGRVLIHLLADALSTPLPQEAVQPRGGQFQPTWLWQDPISKVPWIKQYLARLLIHGQRLNITGACIQDVAQAAIEGGKQYPHIQQNAAAILEVLQTEEAILLKILETVASQGQLAAAQIAALVRNYGLSLALIEQWAQHRGLSLEKERYLEGVRAQQVVFREMD